MKKALEILRNPMAIISANENHVYSKKQIDEAISELEEAMKPKTCDGCKHRSHLNENLTNKITNGFCVENGFFTKHGFCCNKHEPKDNA